ncbi:hypothetical protein [Sphaerisporangium rufum]|nr:hypothetical protein [Sphaerisporangium rufum]
MTTLATGLQAAQELLQDDPGLSLDDAVQLGASAELIDSLGKMGNHEGLSALDLSFKWSPAQPSLPAGIANQIVVPQEQLQRVESGRESLRRRPVIEQDEVIGQVVRLERAEGQEAGVAVIDGHLGPHRRRVKMSLTGRDYHLAIRAHEERRSIKATGEVALESRSWWLRGPIEIRLPLESDS